MVVLDGNRFEFTYLRALAASDTAVAASLAGNRALVLGMTLPHNLILRRSDADDMLRACCRAGAAASAKLSGNHRDTVADLDCVEVAGSGTIAQTQTSVLTLVHAAKQI